VPIRESMAADTVTVVEQHEALAARGDVCCMRTCTLLRGPAAVACSAHRGDRSRTRDHRGRPQGLQIERQTNIQLTFPGQESLTERTGRTGECEAGTLSPSVR
jgi:hypothetical protein